MSGPGNPDWKWVAAIVLIHFVVTIVHGVAHTRAQVPLSAAANIFVFVFIVIGPWFGLILTRPFPRVGSLLIASTMAASFIFGLVNHFVLASPDHISHIDSMWRPLFATTAVLLAASELLGAALATRLLKAVITARTP